MKKFLYILFISSINFIYSQDIISGKVLFEDEGVDFPISGANVFWQGTSKGVITKSNNKYITHYLKFSDQNELSEVTVSKRRSSAQRTYLMPQNIVMISEEELLKAACCNLSESFETNPSVDVNHNDAITGTKQIEMLGLKSPYILITEENIPMVRGASQTFGLGFTPGTWIESIQYRW